MARKATHLRTRARLLATAVGACFATGSYALPTNPTVVNGSASFAQAGNVLNVTNSSGAIINWNTFSIGANETTRFIQSSASSSVLNRVLAADPSVILGTLTSNGRVFLINPNGILVGQGARIDVAGFVASTLNLSDANFLANKLQFDATPNAGRVDNRGSITTPGGGSVFLVAPNVSNDGIITTPQGETILAAGQSVTLLDTATPGVSVEITGIEGNATNLGQIVAEAGRIGIAGVLVRNSGTLNASSVVNEGGRIFLKASRDAYVDGNGRIVTTGTQGGKVEVLGERVAVTDAAEIDASGANGGGEVLIGGDYQGGNPDIQNSTVTYFGADATIKADATENGDGGKVIVWADDTTRAYGRISATGGASGGNGGFVETSGKNTLDFSARVDTRAPLGKTGDLLLDPGSYSIDIATWNSTFGATTSNLALSTDGSGTGNIDFYGSGTGSFTYDLTLLAYGGGTSTGDISFGSGVRLDVSGTAQMIAGWDGNPTAPNQVAGKGNISFTNSVLTGYAGLELAAGNNISVAASGATAALSSPGVIKMYAGGNITATGADPTTSTVFIGSGNPTGLSQIAMYAEKQFNATYTFIGSGGGSNNNEIQLGSGGNMMLTGSRVGNVSGPTAAVTVGAGIQIDAYGGISASTTGGNLVLDNTRLGDDFFSSSIVEVGAMAGSAAAGNISLVDAGIQGGNVGVYGGGDLTVTAINSPTGIISNGDMWVEVGGNINVNGGDSVVASGTYAGMGAYAGLRASGFQRVEAGGNIVLQAGDANNAAYGGWSFGGSAGIMNWGGSYSAGSQQIIADSVELRAGATGHDNSAAIWNSGSGGQYITINGGQLLVNAGGDSSTAVYGGAGSFNNQADVANYNSSSSQIITVYGGGSIVVQAGDGTGTLGWSNSSNNRAEIYNSGLSQNIDFYGGGALTIYGGSAGTDNYAEISGGYSGSQSIGSSGYGSPLPSIAIYGGLSGGARGSVDAVYGGYEWASNDAGIHLDEDNLNGWQSIDASSLYIDARTAAYGGAGMGATNQNISVSGNLTMLGGSSSGFEIDGAPGGAAYIGNMYGANINLNVGGDLTIKGGSGAGGAVLVGSLAGNADVAAFVDGKVDIQGGTGGVAIGTMDQLSAGSYAYVFFDAVGSLDVSGGTGGVRIGSLGGPADVFLYGGGNVGLAAGTGAGGGISIGSMSTGNHGGYVFIGSNGNITVTDSATSAVSIGSGGTGYAQVSIGAAGDLTLGSASTSNAGVKLGNTAGTGSVMLAAGGDCGSFGYCYGLGSGQGGNLILNASTHINSGMVGLAAAASTSNGSKGQITQNAGSTIDASSAAMVYADGNISIGGTISATGSLQVFAGLDNGGYGYGYGGAFGDKTQNSLYGGNISFGAGSVMDAGHVELAANRGSDATNGGASGNIIKDAAATLNILAPASLYIHAAGNVNLGGTTTIANAAPVLIAAGFDNTGGGANAFANKYVSLGRLNAPGSSISINASGAILDGNGNSLNITAGMLDLYSDDGGAAGALAISLDTSVSDGLYASVGSYAANGGIDLRNQGTASPTSIGLYDYSASPGVAFSHSGSSLSTASMSASGGNLAVTALTGGLTLDGGSFTAANASFTAAAGDLTIGSGSFNVSGTLAFKAAAGNMTISTGIDPGSAITADASGNMTITGGLWGSSVDVNAGGALTLTGGYLEAGTLLNVQAGSVTMSGGADMFGENATITTAGALSANGSDIDATQSLTIKTASASFDGNSSVWGGQALDLQSTGAIAIDGGSHVYSNGLVSAVGSTLSLDNGGHIHSFASAAYGGTATGVAIAATNVSLNNGAFIDAPYAGANVEMVVSGGNLTLDNGSYIEAGNDVLLTLTGAGAEVVLNGVSGAAPSTISTGYTALSTHINFLARSSGGIVIDGAQTTTTVSGGSGFYALGSPATLDSGLEITYGATETNNVAAQVIDQFFADLTDTTAAAETTQTTETTETTATASTGSGEEEEQDKEQEDTGSSEGEGTNNDEQKQSNVGKCV